MFLSYPKLPNKSVQYYDLINTVNQNAFHCRKLRTNIVASNKVNFMLIEHMLRVLGTGKACMLYTLQA